jgi:hypothetical protein
MIIAVIMICFAPAAAHANSPQPLPYDNYVLIDDYSQVASAAIFGHDKNDDYALIQKISYPMKTRKI